MIALFNFNNEITKIYIINKFFFYNIFFKTDFFSDHCDDDHMSDAIVESNELIAVKDALLKEAVFVVSDAIGDKPRQPPSQKVRKTLGSLTSIRKSSQMPSAAQSPRDRLHKEMERYIKQETIDCDDDPSVWWKYRVRDFPLLNKLARKYLAVPASSSPSERLFSKAGQIVTSEGSVKDRLSEHACVSGRKLVNIGNCLTIYIDVFH